MRTNRLEAFSDGVLAIIITIMVLELKAPGELTFEALMREAPIFISYLLSFIYIGIYWNNHHHLFQITKKVNGKILWANLHLLFWLSLIPFATFWIGEHHIMPFPVAFYGAVLLMSDFAYYMLRQKIINKHNEDFALLKELGKNLKAKIFLLIYALAIPISFVNSWLAITCYVLIAIIRVIPDKRIENSTV